MSIIKEWIYRFRHNRGFGVQSPAAFYFVMHVLREYPHPYYSYTQLNRMAHSAGDYPAAHCRRLFRISNYVEPRNIITLSDGKGSALAALSAGCNRAPRFTASGIEAMKRHIDNITTIGLLHIGKTQHFAQAVKTALPHTYSKSVIIVEGIHRNRTIRKWWKSIVADPRVVISMDLYSAGILFFDTKYKKQHYTFCFK